MIEHFSSDVVKYCTYFSSGVSEVTKEIEAYTIKNIEMPQMICGDTVGGFLAFLVSVVGARNVLEIGTFTGYSALWMAEKLPSDGKLITLDINSETTFIAKKFWAKSAHGNKIQSIVGPALESLKTITEKFNFIFIDADKVNYLNYFKLALEKLSPNGLIAVDNCLWSGKVMSKTDDPETVAIQVLSEFIRVENTFEKILLPIRDGLFLIRRKTSIGEGRKAQ